MTKEKLSPGMQQYLDIKADYPDAFLLFRMGDFYELFYEDAVEAAQILELTLTSRNKNAENPIPMAGVPFHSAQTYIDTLVSLGHKVAIAEQMEDPKQAVGVVKREVVQVVTPGTVADAAQPDSQNNFLVAIDSDAQGFALAYLDIVTGVFFATSLTDFDSVMSEIRNLKAREVVLGFDLTESQGQLLARQVNLLLSQERECYPDDPRLLQGLAPLEHQVAAKLLQYVHRTQKRELSHLQPVSRYEVKDYLMMDYSTKASLDLLENARTGKKAGSLFWLLDETKTAMGMRQLRSWLDRPLVDRSTILQRQAVVQTFLAHFFERADLIESLKGVYDIERLASRVAFGKTHPKDLLQLAHTLGNVPQIKAILTQMAAPVLAPLLEQLDDIPELYQLISAAIDPDAPASITEGNIIRDGFDETLDKYRRVMRESAHWIADIEAKERAASGIHNLKIDYNRKDGYYFHVTNSQLSHVPGHFFRKATLKNSERFGTEELARIEGDMLEAREKSASLEYDIFMRIRAEVEKYIQRLQALAKTIATIDVLQTFAVVAETYHLVQPDFTDSSSIDIEKGRHVVVEKVMGAQSYIPNSIHFDQDTRIQLITGPNMSGKSTYMRQLAITVIMAQIGAYVPAQKASLPIFDAIFTRIGAADDLVSGQSTFMVEMMEANKAIRLATPQSLILFDELGRGTATYDGMALAQAIIEHIHQETGATTLFATHYHELTALADSLPQLTNVHVATLEEDGQVTFLHQIAPGPADKSYGIHVAKIAGLPERLLNRAETVLAQLESQSKVQSQSEVVLTESTAATSQTEGIIPVPQNEMTSAPVNQTGRPEQLDLFSDWSEHPALDMLRKLDLYNLTPMQVMNAVAEMKKKL